MKLRQPCVRAERARRARRRRRRLWPKLVCQLGSAAAAALAAAAARRKEQRGKRQPPTLPPLPMDRPARSPAATVPLHSSPLTDRERGRQVLLIIMVVVVVGPIGPPTANITTMRARPPPPSSAYPLPPLAAPTDRLQFHHLHFRFARRPTR